MCHQKEIPVWRKELILLPKYYLIKTIRQKSLQRMDTYFMKPDKPYEITGQVNHVCFVEGLVNYKDKWFLYYGTADSKIAVAVK